MQVRRVKLGIRQTTGAVPAARIPFLLLGVEVGHDVAQGAFPADGKDLPLKLLHCLNLAPVCRHEHPVPQGRCDKGRHNFEVGTLRDLCDGAIG